MRAKNFNHLKIGTMALLALPTTALAAAPAPDLIDITTRVSTNISDLKPSVLVSGAINLILGISGIVAFFMLLIGGIQWILAGGDKEGTEKARKRITAALIGLAIVFSAYALLFIMSALFNINLVNFTLLPLGTITGGQ